MTAFRKSKFPGVYKDKHGIGKIVFDNDGETLTVEIAGVKFSGREFSDLEIVDENNYDPKQLERFAFSYINIHNTDDFIKNLCDCSFEILVSQTIIDVQNKNEFETDVQLTYILGKPKAKISTGLEKEELSLMLTLQPRLRRS